MASSGIPQISTGDILRRNIADGTALGIKAKDLMSQGKLVPDELVNDMVGDRLNLPDVARGYILDGYPRTLGQAEWLDQQLGAGASAQAAKSLPLVAINLRLDPVELLRRITGRRICPVCKRSYNIYSQPPLKPGICDTEGATLEQRPDDTEEAFHRRMAEYDTKTAPVIAHYRAQGRFHEVDGSLAIPEVASAVLAALRHLRQATV